MTISPSPGRPRLILRTGALHAGYDDDEIRRLRRAGAWTSVLRGAYVPTADMPRLNAPDRHRLLIQTLLPRLSGDPVVSHVSAAVLHGLPLWLTHVNEVHVTRRPPAKAHRGPMVHSYTSALETDDVVLVGHRAVVADAALRARRTTPDQLAAQLTRVCRMPGARDAARVIKFADGRSESVGESRSRVMLHRAGLPPPELQLAVHDDGLLLGRADFGYRRRKVLGEFDGRAKYAGGFGVGETPGEAAFREKVREEALRAAGWAVVRWIWVDLDSPEAVVRRIQRALGRGGTVSTQTGVVGSGGRALHCACPVHPSP